MDENVNSKSALRDTAEDQVGKSPDVKQELKDKTPEEIIHELQVEIKNDNNLKRIPVVILTSSEAEQDIVNSYNLHANCYITKPVELDQFIGVIKNIEQFRLTIVKLPPGD